MRDLRRLKAVGLAVAIAALASGCGGATHVSAPPRSPSSATTGGQPGMTPSVTVPNPFAIVARYSASSLGLNQPIDLAIGPDGNIYVTDTKPSVTVISPAGKVLRRWGRSGSHPGEFSFQEIGAGGIHASIAVGPDGKVYVSDSGNSRVEVFAATGAFIRQFGSSGVKDGQFLAVFDLAVDGSGNVYVADDEKLTLSKFSAAGRFEWSIGGTAATDRDLASHFHLSNVDSHGRVVAASEEADRIVYIDTKGHKVDTFGTAGDLPAGSSPCNVTVNSAGYTIVESCLEHVTLVFDRTHHLVGAWDDSPFLTDAVPGFGLHGEVFALGQDGSILELKVALLGA